MNSKAGDYYAPGLEGIVAGETALSTIEEGLRYRGYPITELAEKTSFEEVAYLLLYGELPKRKELDSFIGRIALSRRLPEPLIELLRALPRWTAPMDALRTAVSVLAHFDQDATDASMEANLRKAERLLGQIPLVVAAHYRISKGLPWIMPRPDLSHAAGFLYTIHGSEPSPEAARALDVSLILYAEHEFNASTFTARVIASTLSDLHSAVVGAIGALKGPLHGGANEVIMDFLQQLGTPEQAVDLLRQALARKERIMGFGHRVYKTGDLRAGILSTWARLLAEKTGQSRWEQLASLVERVMAEEKNLYPNLDWPAGRLYHYLGLEKTLYTPIFVMARVAGWCAHVMEQLANNRLIRPRARYIGPARRAVLPLAERDAT
ncbi:MAG: citrate synthase [Gemmataceae bacterium]